MERVSPELSERIQRSIDGIETDDTLGRWLWRVCRDDLNALPLCGNQIYLWALRPDGTVLCVDHESFARETEPETDPLVLYAVLSHGLRDHPELGELVPAPPAGARPCGSCDGTGIVERGPEISETCLGCRGLGWVG